MYRPIHPLGGKKPLSMEREREIEENEKDESFKEKIFTGLRRSLARERFMLSALQATARGGAKVVSTLAEPLVGRERATIKPKGVGKVLYGKEDITPLTQSAEELRSKAKEKGLEGTGWQLGATALPVAGVALDITPLGGEKAALKKIIKVTTGKQAVKMIEKLGLKYSDDLAKKLINTKTTKEAKSLIEEAKKGVKTLASNSKPLQEGGKIPVIQKATKGAHGTFDPNTGKVTVENLLDNETIIHEVAHKKYGALLPEQQGPLDDTLRNLSEKYPGIFSRTNDPVENIALATDEFLEMKRTHGKKFGDVFGKTQGGRDLAKFFKSVIDESSNNIQKLSQPLQEGGEIAAKVPEASPLRFEVEPLGKKTRKTVETLTKSPNLSRKTAKLIKELPEATYDPSTMKPLYRKADEQVFDNVVEAEYIARTETTARGQATLHKLVQHLDGLATKADKLGNTKEATGLREKIADVVSDNLIARTEAGQFIQAGRGINMFTPEGIIGFVNKLVKRVGGKDVKFTNEMYADLIKKVEFIQGIADPKAKAFAQFELLEDIYSKIPTSMRDKIYETINIPRALMATADVSAGFRQGIFIAARRPKQFAKEFIRQFKYLTSEKAYKNLKADIVTDVDYPIMKKNGLALADLQHGLSAKEEAFMSTWAEKIPGIGKITRASQRAYTGLLNKLRFDYYKDFLKKADELGITDEKYFKDAAEFVGAATGRGGLGNFERSAVALNAVLFSPRLMISRLKLLNPIYYAKLHPEVRKEALKSLFSFAGATMGVLTLAKMAGAEVGADPRSADFGKIKIRDTRIDIMGGFQQYIRMAAQITSGKYVSSTTGKEITLGEGYGSATRWDIFLRQLESKESPVASFATAILKGKDYTGKDVKVGKEIGQRFVPMVIQDIYDIAKEDPSLLPLGMLGMTGMGLQTYRLPDWEDASAVEKYQILNEMPTMQAQERLMEMRKTDRNAYAKIRKYTQWDKLKLNAKEKGFSTLGVEDGRRAEEIYKYLIKQDNPEQTFQKLRKARIISPEVAHQIIALKKQKVE